MVACARFCNAWLFTKFFITSPIQLSFYSTKN
jgi:hypothetical protein